MSTGLSPDPVHLSLLLSLRHICLEDVCDTSFGTAAFSWKEAVSFKRHFIQRAACDPRAWSWHRADPRQLS